MYRWVFDPARMDLPELARTVGRAYVTADMMLAYPQARLSDKVPQSASVRKGDFGELIAQGLYSTRMGREVPFTKLQLAKPVSNATVQGPDTLCLTIDQGESVEPVIVEAKARTSSSPSQVLDPIAGSFGGVSEEYCIEGWAAGVQMMRAHPDYRREFAFTAAQHLGRLTDPDAALPPHLRHAVVVVPQDRLTLMKIKERWSDSPPVCQLHVVVVPDLLDTINALFEAASRLTYADLTRGASILLEDPREHHEGRERNSRYEDPPRLAGDSQQHAGDQDERGTREDPDHKHKVPERGHEDSLPRATRIGGNIRY